jgi:TonB family protein
MAPLPPLTPSPPDSPGSRVRVRTHSSLSDEILHSSGSSEIILVKLRGMIARGGLETDAILGTIAVAAHALTGANGAAIAMPRGGAVMCVGRSGEIAPELGDLLNLDSGISGECLRTGRIMRCDDASRDFHVDADVCRQLNLQSIAVVPLRGRQGRVGVLESFSSRSYAFSEEHMELLGRLAGLAEAAWAQAPEEQVLRTGKPVAPVSESTVLESSARDSVVAERVVTQTPTPRAPVPPPVTRQPLAKATPGVQSRNQGTQPVFDAPAVAVPSASSPLIGASEALTRAGAAISAGLHTELRNERRWRYGAIAGGAVVLILLMILGWKVWYKASLPARTAARSQATAVSTNPDGSTGIGMVFEPGVASSTPRSKGSGTRKTPSLSAAQNSASRPSAASPGNSNPARNLFVKNDTGGNPGTTAAVEAPQAPTVNGQTTGLGDLLPASPALPKLTVPISQGISGGVLLQKVLPVYPSEARQLHVKGTVVLAGTINERGQIEDVKLVSGPSLLAGAAMDAVRKWRYSPYLLNGKPIRKETEISVTFIP